MSNTIRSENVPVNSAYCGEGNAPEGERALSPDENDSSLFPIG
jgi:hypothetical protein